jgi:biopolymer transport protein ExbB/TolQ
LPVLLVLLVLLVFSFMSWVIIIRKYSQTKAAMQNAEAFEERFWSGGDLAQLFREVSNAAATTAASRTSSNRASANSPPAPAQDGTDMRRWWKAPSVRCA